MAALVVRTGKLKGAHVRLKSDRDVYLGRGDDCQIRLRSKSVSRRHCMVRREDDQLIVRDLDSANGTWVNDERVDGEVRLVDGDELRVGRILFEIKLEEKQRAEASGTESIQAWLQGEDDGGPKDSTVVFDVGSLVPSETKPMQHLSVERFGDVVLVRSNSRRIDEDSHAGFVRELVELVETGYHNIVLNLGGVEYVYSAGLSGLLTVADAVKKVDGQFCLCGLEPVVMDVLQSTQLAKMFLIVHDESLALSELQKK